MKIYALAAFRCHGSDSLLRWIVSLARQLSEMIITVKVIA
jgi:hypothetical protein